MLETTKKDKIIDDWVQTLAAAIDILEKSND